MRRKGLIDISNTRSFLVSSIDFFVYYFTIAYAFFLGISFIAVKICLGATIGLVIIRNYILPYNIKFSKGLIWVLSFFICSIGTSALLSTDPLNSLRVTLSYTIYFPPFFLAGIFVQTYRQYNKIYLAFLLSMTLVSLIVIINFLHGDGRTKIFDFFYMIIAGYLLQTVVISWVLGLTQNRIVMTNFTRRFFCCVSILSGLALIMNGTRGAWLAMGLSLGCFAVFSFFYGSKRNAILTCCFLGCFCILAYSISTAKVEVFALSSVKNIVGYLAVDQSVKVEVDQSISERLLMWKSAWRMFEDHPLTGVGTGLFGAYYNSQYISPFAKEQGHIHAHNIFLHFLAENGLLGFAGFVSLFGYIFWNCIKKLHKEKSNSEALVAILLTIAFLGQGLTEFNWIHIPLLRMYWLMMGLTYHASELPTIKEPN